MSGYGQLKGNPYNLASINVRIEVVKIVFWIRHVAPSGVLPGRPTESRYVLGRVPAIESIRCTHFSDLCYLTDDWLEFGTDALGNELYVNLFLIEIEKERKYVWTFKWHRRQMYIYKLEEWSEVKWLSAADECWNIVCDCVCLNNWTVLRKEVKQWDYKNALNFAPFFSLSSNFLQQVYWIIGHVDVLKDKITELIGEVFMNSREVSVWNKLTKWIPHL